MDKDVKEYCKGCFTCQVAKGQIDSKIGEIQHFPATRPFQIVAMDLVGPLPETETGYQYILTILDRFTHYVSAIPLRTQTAKEVALTFFNEWICKHGVPETILSDNATQLSW